MTLNHITYVNTRGSVYLHSSHISQHPILKKYNIRTSIFFSINIPFENDDSWRWKDYCWQIHLQTKLVLPATSVRSVILAHFVAIIRNAHRCHILNLIFWEHWLNVNHHSLNHGVEPFLRSRQLCSYSRTPQDFMEPKSLLSCSQEPSIGPYPEPDQFNPYKNVNDISVNICYHYTY
jgi:hypothetical protein